MWTDPAEWALQVRSGVELLSNGEETYFITGTSPPGARSGRYRPGCQVLDDRRECPILALELSTALSDPGWGRWKSLTLPHVPKHASTLLQSHAREAAQLPAAPQWEKHLASVGIACRRVDGRIAR